jgi:hypothetical protein
VRVNPGSGSAIRYPSQHLSAFVLRARLIVPPTVGLAIDVGRFTADARVGLDGDLVNVFVDAGHACDFVMITVCR